MDATLYAITLEITYRYKKKDASFVMPSEEEPEWLKTNRVEDCAACFQECNKHTRF